jgi:asparagine synthase (glutamine-hydrolysing)
MKLQLGLLNTDGRRATRDDLATLLGEFVARPAETSGEVIDGSLVMAYRGDRITFEEDSEVQPLQLGPYMLTWDGRLDNRADFTTFLGIRVLPSVSDPEIVLKAHRMFGASVFERLIGEFALTLWCQRTRSLFFVRSACGARTLYYVLDKNTLTWSSDFAHLVRVSGVALDVNENYVLEYLVSQPSTKQTPLTKVDAVPANSMVCFENGRLKFTRQLWDPTRILPLRYRSDGEYEEHCREKLTEAVRVRLRAKHPVFSELSGGLDSSSLVLMGDRALAARNKPLRNLRTVSCVYEESQTCDERNFIRAVEEKRGIDTVLVHEDDQQITMGLKNPTFTGIPNGLHCFPGRYPKFADLMREHKSRVLLSGRGGDHLFWSEPDGASIIADEMCRGNLFRALRECREWSRFMNVPYHRLMMGRALPLAVRSYFPEMFQYSRQPVPEWIAPNRSEATEAALSGSTDFKAFRAIPSQQAKLCVVEHMFRFLGSGFLSEYRELYVSHPYSHRPLVEFCFAVPISQFLRDGQTRSLMRRALSDVLPRKTAKRAGKGLLDEALLRALRREWDDVSDVRMWQVCQRDFVEPKRLSDALQKMRLGFLDQAVGLLRLVSLERWLRSLSHVRANPEPRAAPASAFAESPTLLPMH